MFAMSEDQKKIVVENDNRAKKEYLSKAPAIASAGVKNMEVYSNIVRRMKSRVEANFKV